MSSMLSKLKIMQDQALKSLQQADDWEKLQDVRRQHLGKKSPLATLLGQIKDWSPEEKIQAGKQINLLKTKLQEALAQRESKLKEQLLDQQLQDDWLDVTYEKPYLRGAIHPVMQTQRQIEQICTAMGFQIADGPDVESEWHNFEALNIPANHPARDMQDTFFVKTGASDAKKNSVLRTHTSAIQIRSMLEQGAPIRLIAPGKVFRHEAVDSTHDAVFSQVEGLMVDKGISLAHMRAILEKLLQELFAKPVKMRFRPGYFPFVEPGLELDIWWDYVDKNGKSQGKWLEMMGGGMVHPQVLRNCNIDPDIYQGFAFGFGLSRLVMMKYGINDIRLLSSAKREFLSQF